MSISSELLTLQNTKTAIRTAINNKGGSVGASDTFASYATAIDNLPSGGSGNPLLTSIDVSDFSGTTFNRALSYITDVTIPSGVTSIAFNALSGCSGLTSITIPNTVTTIGNSAFSSCSGLTSITIPNSVTSLGNNVFQNCTSLTSAELSSGLTSIPTYTFYGCESLSSVNIKNGITSIGISAFYGCTSLTSVTFPSSLTTIENEAFRTCSGLTSITLPSNVSSIGDSVFNSCTSLTSVELSSGLTSIGNYTFNGCNGLTSITIPSGVIAIGMYAFTNCSGLTSIICLATTPPLLGSSAFYNTNNCPIYVPAASVDTYKAASVWSSYSARIYAIAQVATVDNTPVYNYDLGMTSSTTMITSTNMQKMPTGTSLELAEGIVDAGGSFGNYTSITLPSTFSSFDDQGMIGNTTTTLTCLATTPPTAERNDIGGANLTAIYVPAASVSDYQAASGWSNFASIIQAIPTE